MKNPAVSAIALLAMLAAGTARAAEKHPPNIVFILADDMGWSDTGALGAKRHPTPAIEKLASQGVTFDNFHMCQNCAPSRACLISGKYETRTGIYTVGTLARGKEKDRTMKVPENVDALPLDIPTIADRLRAAGYATAMFGKWHLGYDAAHLPDKRGFDEAIATQNGPHTNFKTWPATTVPKDEYMADWLTDKAVDYIARHKTGKPFFLYVPHTAVHTPIHASKSDIDLAGTRGGAGAGYNPTYAGMVAAVDRSVERIVKAIDDNGLKDDTLIVFSSDNGGVTGFHITDNAPLRGGKGEHYEGGLRVPFIVRGAGVGARGVAVDTPAVHVDIPATFVALAGPKAAAGGSLDGESLLPWIENPEAPHAHGPIFGHLPGYLEAQKKGAVWRTTPVSHIISGDRKLMVFWEDDHAELYDLKNDPSEKTDLAKTKPDEVRALRARLEKWLKDTHAAMPVKK